MPLAPPESWLLIQDQLKKLLKKKIKSNITNEEILPIELKLFDKRKKKYFDSFNEAIDSIFSEKIKNETQSSAEKTKNKELERINIVIEQQEETIKGLKISAEENKKKGEFIYENYDKIKAILNDLNTARKKLSWEEIKRKLKENKTVKQINEKEGKITIEL